MDAKPAVSLEELLAQAGWLRALASSLVRDSASAEDLVQDTWLVALTRRPRSGRPLRPWLARVARNLASNRRRAEGRRTEHELDAALPSVPQPAEEIVGELEAQRALVEALLQLEEPLRSTLVLRYYRGLDASQIARRQGVPAGTVRWRLKRGIDELRARLDARFGGSRSSWCLLLEPLALGKLAAAGSTGAVAGGALALGVLVMSASVKVAAATAVLGIAGGWWWYRTAEDGRPAEPPPAISGLQRPSVPASTESDLAPTRPDEDSRSAQAIEPSPDSGEVAEAAGPGASIAGIVLVNGGPPSEPISLRLSPTNETPSGDERRITVTSDGRFEFAGLTAGLRARIRIPYRYRFIQSSLYARTSAVEAPQEGVVLDLERWPCLTGRLVSLQDREPLEDTRLSASITWREGSQQMAGADFEGSRFFVPLIENSEIGRVSLEAWTDTGLRGTFEFEGEEIPPDLDLGELALAAGGVARLVVLDPERRPVSGARVRAQRIDGIVEETDSEGRATLQGLPPEATLEVLARGFDPVQFAAPISSEPIEVVLHRANRLTICVLGPAGDPQPGVGVKISSEKRLFVQSRATLHPSLVPQIATRGEIARRNEKGCFTRFIADDRGRVELQSVLPGMSLTVSLEDEIGSSVHEEVVLPLRPQEEREVTIRLAREPRSVSGVVEDLLGQPLEAARVTLRGGSRGTGRTTGVDGRFQFEGLFAKEVELTVARRGFVSAGLSQVPVLRNAPPLHIRLEPSRDVRISVIDARGNRIDAGSVSAWLPGEDRHLSSESRPDGLRLLLDAPALELQVRLQLAGKQFLQTLPAYADELVMSVPELGRLEVTCEPDPCLPVERLGLLLRSTDEGIEQSVLLLPTRTAPAEFEVVLPGTYDLSFFTWEEQGSDAALVPLRAPMRVQVAPGETTRVQLR